MTEVRRPTLLGNSRLNTSVERRPGHEARGRVGGWDFGNDEEFEEITEDEEETHALQGLQKRSLQFSWHAKPPRGRKINRMVE